MLAKFKEMPVNSRVFTVLAIIACLFGVYLAVNNWISGEPTTPISAAGMTIEERAEIDEAVLLDALTEYNATTVRMNYDDQAIAVTIDALKSDQYISHDADEIADAVESALVERRGEMTLELDSYFIYVYDKNDSLIEFYTP
ncbi:hypothetical protein [Cytobacillus gottheilii]|uniref:Uncharacterized protein n=1 Tax=Cytobacillus gottheilii TaxID=859144 RepID=A0ABX8FG45_9BACI|nr:hypothetical protein [Cytobacillus gottheilii]QVY63004.1 hypothetical protein J1899_08170 [Cytobacillus gottheilii]